MTYREALRTISEGKPVFGDQQWLDAIKLLEILGEFMELREFYKQVLAHKSPVSIRLDFPGISINGIFEFVQTSLEEVTLVQMQRYLEEFALEEDDDETM